MYKQALKDEVWDFISFQWCVYFLLVTLGCRRSSYFRLISGVSFILVNNNNDIFQNFFLKKSEQINMRTQMLQMRSRWIINEVSI